ncbi:MAG: hypothetical protein C4291_14320 [Candidatus Dadabacteria bacterium]
MSKFLNFPIIIPFIIGLLVGAIVKRTIKLVLGIVALALILVVSGYVGLTLPDIFSKTMEVLHRIVKTGQALLDVLPYSSITFLARGFRKLL